MTKWKYIDDTTFEILAQEAYGPTLQTAKAYEQQCCGPHISLVCLPEFRVDLPHPVALSLNNLQTRPE